MTDKHRQHVLAVTMLNKYRYKGTKYFERLKYLN